MGSSRNTFVDAGTLTGAPDLAPRYLPTPEGTATLLAPPVTAPVELAPVAHPAAPAPFAGVPTDLDSPIAVFAPTAPPLVEAPKAPERPPVSRGVAARGVTRNRGDVALTIAGIGLGICVGIGVYATKDGLDLPGGKMLAVGTLSALVGTYLSLMMILLMARIPWIERELGHDRLVVLHRTVAPYGLFLIVGHVVFTTISYAQAEEHSVLGQIWDLVTKSAWMMPAAAAFVMMMGLGVISYRGIRNRMKYETWWVSHLYFYIAVALSFGHQVALGPMFIAHPYQRYFWTALYIAVFVTILVSRIIVPLSLSRKHQLRVESVVPEGDHVVSIYISGVDLDLLRARGGQFFQWRFMTRDWWWQAHPYSLSAAPNGSWLRITVKDLGDQSHQLRKLRPGTKVVAEGPYGVFTAGSRHGESIAAFAAGVGITPIRAVLEDLPDGTAVTLVYRVPDVASAPLRTELEELVTSRGWRLHYLQGPRHLHPLSGEYLTQLVPGLAATDVYICGPESYKDTILEAVRDVGVPEHRIHHEEFVF
jgi:predicted ferric reductase